MKTTHDSFFRRVALTLTLVGALVTSAQAAETVSVIKDGVNIRTEPQKDAPVTMEVFKGYPLQIVEKEGEWLKVKDFEGDTGWIFASLTTTGNTVIVNAKNAINMRAEPNTTSAVVANVERGVVLTRLEAKDKWIKVEHSEGAVGWISKTLVWP